MRFLVNPWVCKDAQRLLDRLTISRWPIGITALAWRRQPIGVVILVAMTSGVASTNVRGADPSSDKPLAANASGLLPGHSVHGEAFNEGPRQAAYPIPGTGNVRFPVEEVSPEVQALITQGVGQLHGFWYYEAERSFRQAATLDPHCAVAYWGMAMANGHLNKASHLERARKFIAQAVERKQYASTRIRKYIDALDGLLKADPEATSDDLKRAYRQASEDYIRAMQQIVYDFPDDIEARAFIAVHLWQRRADDRSFGSHLAVDALIQEVLDVEPMHPVHHYRIHLWDDEKPARALESAARCGQSAPAIAHMWHMPGHTYSNLQRYQDAVWQQEASARTDHARMMRDQLLPDQIHNFAHNNEWLIRNLIFVGRLRDAVDLAKNMIELPQHPDLNTLARGGCSAAWGRERLLQTLEQGEMWETLIQLSDTVYLPRTDEWNHQVDWHRALGRAADRLNRWDLFCEHRQKLETMRDEKLAAPPAAAQRATEETRTAQKSAEEIEKARQAAHDGLKDDLDRVDQALKELTACHLARQGQWTAAIERAEQAGTVSPYWLADLYAGQGQLEKGLRKLRDTVKSHPNETIPLAQLAAHLWRAGQVGEARDVMERLRPLTAQIDLDARPYARLTPLAAAMEWGTDWRAPFVASNDVGDRPDLTTLGPFRWQPPMAPAWTLVDATGKSRSLQDYAGRTVVVIFYLGSGCLHCAQQLQAFGPKQAEFAAAGIDIVAISSDDAEGLQTSVKNYDGGTIPFPLVSNASLDVFRAYRCHDDFEQRALHGTFVIDGRGQIRWHDIGHEPFMDPTFVLKEAQRLRSLSTEPQVQLTERR